MHPDAALYARLASPDASPRDRGRALRRLGDLHRDRGELDAARAAYDASLALDPSPEAHLGRGIVALMTGEEAAEAHFQAAVSAADPETAASATANLGAVLYNQGRTPEARSRFEQALARRRDAGLAPDALVLCNLARCAARDGDAEAARSWFAEARRVGDGQPGVMGLLALLEGEWLAESGADAEATAPLEAAAAALASPADRARALTALAGARVALGDLRGAADAWTAALPALRAALAPAALAGVLSNLGGTRYRLQDFAGAAEALDEAHALLPTTGQGTRLERQLRANRGLALLAVGRSAEARRELERAAELSRAGGAWELLARQLCSLVDIRRFEGDLPGAIALQGELIALSREHGVSAGAPGGLATAIEDRSLNISTGGLGRRGPAPRRGPVLILCPAAHGATGPLFPRGAVSMASFLQAHGVPARVLPLAHVIEPDLPYDVARARGDAALADAIATLRPQAIGISVTFSYLYPQGQAIARAVRALDPEVPIVIGGPHVTYQDRECLEETPEIDVVVRGEGEWTGLDLFEALRTGADLAGVAGVTWRAPDGAIVRNPKRALGDVRALPPVDFGLLPADFCHRMDTSALTSRGCSFRCKFCHEFRYWGGVVREHPVERIIGEMERLAVYDNYLLGIDDSMLDMRTDYFHDLVRRLGQSPWLSPNFGLLTRLDTVTAEGSAAMAAARMRWVSVGMESGSQRVLDAMNKGITTDQTRTGLTLARDAGLQTASFLIIGHPGDNPTESAVTLDFVDRLWGDDLLVWLDLSTFTPYPGTPFYSMPDRHGVEILTRDWSLWRRTNRPVAQLVDYSAPEIYQNLLRMLEVQDRHIRARDAGDTPPPLGAGAAATA